MEEYVKEISVKTKDNINFFVISSNVEDIYIKDWCCMDAINLLRKQYNIKVKIIEELK